jgi:hypothetical protein
MCADPDSWKVRGYGTFKVVLAPEPAGTRSPIDQTVVLVRRALIKEGLHDGEDGRRSWETLAEQTSEAAALFPAATVPNLVALPSSDSLKRSISRIMERAEVPVKPHHDRLPWPTDFEHGTLWATSDVHHLSQNSYGIEVAPYSWWTLDLRRSNRAEFVVSDGTRRFAPQTLPSREVKVSLRAGRHIPLDTRKVYEFEADEMTDWLRANRTELPDVIQRRAVTVGGNLHFHPTASQWAQSIQQIEAHDERILPLLAEELVRLLAVLRRVQESIPPSGLDVHRLRKELALGRARDQLVAASVGDASIVVIALQQADCTWKAHGHIVDVEQWTSAALDAWCRRVRRAHGRDAHATEFPTDSEAPESL